MILHLDGVTFGGAFADGAIHIEQKGKLLLQNYNTTNMIEYCTKGKRPISALFRAQVRGA